MTYTEYTLYALLWLSFGVTHSVLAGHPAKRTLAPLLGRSYRLSYNLISALHIGLVIIGGYLWLGTNSVTFAFANWIEVLITTVRWLGIAILLASLTQYDLGLFGGLKQLRYPPASGTAGEDEALHLDGFHRYVRHPLYLGAYCFLWGGAQHEFGLQTAIWGSLYLDIGTWFEERRLVAQYGDDYIEYRKQVPAILPWRGRSKIDS